MWITTSKVFKIIKVVSNIKNNFTIDLKEYYNKIQIPKSKIKIYCIPNYIQTIDTDTGYEINIDTDDNEYNYVYKIYSTSKGIINAPLTIDTKSYIENEVNTNFEKTYEINKDCKYININYVATLGVASDVKHKLYIYLDENVVKTFEPYSYFEFTSQEFFTQIESNNEHKLKIKSTNTYTTRFAHEFYTYIITAQYLDKFINEECELNCFFVLEE